jgi:hypothetical protein
MVRQCGRALSEGSREGRRVPGKKLIDAARFLAAAAKGDPADDGKDAADAAAVFGLAVPEVEAKPETFGLLAENVEAIGWFMKMQTQWRVDMAGRFGLDYGVFILWAKDEGVKRRDRVWLLEDLRLVEREFLGVMRADP